MKEVFRYAIFLVIGVMPGAVIGFNWDMWEWWAFNLPYWIGVMMNEASHKMKSNINLKD